MKIKEIVEMSTDELLTKKRDLRQESLHLRLQQQSGQLEQPSRLRLVRRDVARIETVLSQRAKAAAQAAPRKKSARKKAARAKASAKPVTAKATDQGAAGVS